MGERDGTTDANAVTLALSAATGRDLPSVIPEPGRQRIGRYRLERILGRGGMGLVYAAWDEELERRVALKLLHADRIDGHQVARLRREAQALAQLSHENVVTVFEVDEHDGQVFIAMELVQGRSLDRWLAKKVRTWREVLDVFIAAGRGLSAAHEKGLVHRDFKPANVIIADDGRVKVLDFGLARPPHPGDSTGTASGIDPITNPSTNPIGDGPRTALDDALTEAGTVLGTPAYMAPEQYRRQAVDARTDQYALCVALFEGLFGRRAFVAPDPGTLRRRIEAGDFGTVDRGEVPLRVWRIVRRGMAPDPDARHRSMATMLAALDRARRPSSARWVLGGAGVLGVAGLVALAIPTSPQCTADDAHWAGVWDDARRAELADAFEHSGLGYATAASSEIAARMDAFVEDWQRARTAACGLEAQTQLDARMLCLERAKVRASTLLDAFAAADQGAIQRAVRAVTRLPSPAACASDGDRPVPAAIAAAVASVEADLSRVEASLDAGRLGEDGVAQTEALLERARALEHAPLVAEVLSLHGRVLRDAGRYEDARLALEEAFWTASEVGNDRLAAGTSAVLVFLLAQYLGDVPAARTWAGHAEGALQRLGEDPSVAASYHNAMGILEQREGSLKRALEHYRTVEVMLRAVRGDLDPDVATALGNQGNVLRGMERLGEAELAMRSALELRRTVLGSDHPDVGSQLADLASVLADRGRFEDARTTAEEALEITRTALGPEHPKVMMMLGNLATIQERLGDFDAAAATAEGALAAATASLGPDHPNVAVIMHNLGGLRRLQGRVDEAVTLLEGSHVRMVATWGDNDPQVAASLINLGLAHLAAEHPERALEHLERARTIADAHDQRDTLANATTHVGDALRALGRLEDAQAAHREAAKIWRDGVGEPGVAAIALTGLGVDLLEAGDGADAVEPLREAITLLEGIELSGVVAADAQFALARALRASGADSDEAVALATQARDRYRETGGVADALADEVDAWLGHARSASASASSN